MGRASGFDLSRRAQRRKLRGRRDDIRPPNIVRSSTLVTGVKPSKRKHPVPRVGRRFGELTVTGFEVGKKGGLVKIVVRCSCKAPEHPVDPTNLYAGRSTRCPICARKSGSFWLKKYHGYADVCPNQAHRTRLLGRISAIHGRCNRQTKYPNFADYGGRGILVHKPWRRDRRAFLTYLVTLPGWDDPKLSHQK